MKDDRKPGIKRLLAPRHIAFIGGRNLLPGIDLCHRSGFSGDIFVVSDRHEEIAGIACHRRPGDLPVAPDAAFIAVGREATVSMVRDLAGMGAGGAACFAAGFAELGADGQSLQQELVAAAGPSLALLGPNCLGIINAVNGGTMWLVPGSDRRVARGPALITQSGGLGLHIMMNQRSVDFSYVVSVGNQAVLGVEDFIDDLIERDEVSAIGIYLEGLRDGRRFHRAGRRALELGKPIAVLKGGRSEVGAAMTMTHTSSLAGNPERYAALFSRLGIANAGSAGELLETLKLFHLGALPKGRKTVIFTCSGGSSSVAADAASEVGLELPKLSEDTSREIAGHLPAFASVSNPLDYNTSLWGREDELVPVFAAALGEGMEAGVLAIDFTPPVYGSDHNEYAVCRALVRAGRQTGVPVYVASILSDLMPEAARRFLADEGVPALQGVDDALAALGHAADFVKRRDGMPAESLLGDPPDGAGARLLSEHDSKRELAAFGLACPRGEAAALDEVSAVARRLGGPVAVKILSDRILHKTEIGGVRLGLTGPEEAQAVAERMAREIERATGEAPARFLVEAMIPGAVAELIVGVVRDPVFGAVLALGAGGTLTELLRDRALLIVPFTREDARAALSRLRVASLLAGLRGGPPGDVEAVLDAVMAVQRYVTTNATVVVEIDVNPLMVLPRGQGAIAADAVIRRQVRERDADSPAIARSAAQP